MAAMRMHLSDLPYFQLQITKGSQILCCEVNQFTSRRPRVAPSQQANTAGRLMQVQFSGTQDSAKGQLWLKDLAALPILCCNCSAVQSETFLSQPSFLPSPPQKLDGCASRCNSCPSFLWLPSCFFSINPVLALASWRTSIM